MTICEPFNHETSAAIYELRKHCSDHIKILNVIHFIEFSKLYFGLFKCFPPNYICCFSSTWLKIYLHPKSPVKKKKPSIQEHTICTAMHDTQVTDSFRSESNGGKKCHKACCVCFLVIYLTFQTIFMLKEYLSNIWRVSACYSSQKRKITGFNPEIKRKKNLCQAFCTKSLYLSSKGPRPP